MSAIEKSHAQLILPSPNPGNPPPFHEMSDDVFEKMCCALLAKEPGIKSADLYRLLYKPQFGIDVLGKLDREEKIDVVSCKCTKRIRKGELVKWSNHFLEHYENHWQPQRVRCFVLAVAADVISSERETEIKAEEARFLVLGMAYEIWYPCRLQEKLRPHPGIVTQYLGQEWVVRLCGPSASPTQDPTITLKKVSEQNLRESGEISDERGSLDLQDLYITRDCETKIIHALQGSKEPLFVTGVAGCGKTSILWRISNRLLEDHADIYFFRADFLVSDEGFQDIQNIPFATKKASYIIIDTVDSIVGRSESRHRLQTILDECSNKGYTVAAAIRPLEKNRYFTTEKSFSIPEVYNEQEFSRVVESHVKAFYRLKDVETIAARVEEIKSIASGTAPVVDLAYRPLTLRMLFSVYAPNEIPTEVNSISLYLEFWKKRVEADWRAGRPDSEPNSRNLSKSAAWIAESMLLEGSILIGQNSIDLAISQGKIAREDLVELTTRGILHTVTDGFEFFHQTFFEFSAAWGMIAGESSITLNTLYSHLKDNQFDSLRIPVFQNALTLGQLIPGDQEAMASRIMIEVLELQPESLIFSALFASAQSPSLDPALETALSVALKDRKNAALFIRMSPSAPRKRLPAIWSVFRGLYEAEQRDEPERNPRAVRVALIVELPRMVGRLPELTDEVIVFLGENAVIDGVTAADANITGIELSSIATLLFETSRQQPELSCELFIEVCSRLCQRVQKHNESLWGFIVTFCQSKYVPRQAFRQVTDLIDGIEDTKAESVRAFLKAREWDEKKGVPLQQEYLHDITDSAHVQLLQCWTRGKSTSCWMDLWNVFSRLCEVNGSNRQFLSVWVRELWEKLDKHPLEPDGDLSFRAFEFLSELIAEALTSSNAANQFAAQKVCMYIRSQRVLSEIFARIRNEAERVLTEKEVVDAFLPVMIRDFEEFDSGSERFSRLLTRKSARKKVIAAAAELIDERPELWRGMTDFLVKHGELHRLEAPIATGEIRAQPLGEKTAIALSKAVAEGIESQEAEERHRAARVAHMALSEDMGLNVEYKAIREAFEREQDPRVAAWLAMCAMEVASANDEIESAYKSLLTVCASGDQYVRDRATTTLVRAIVNRATLLNVEEFLDAMRTNINLRKLCEAAQLVSGIAASNTSAAKRIAEFLLLDKMVNSLGKTILTSFRIQSRHPMMQWVRLLPARSVVSLIEEIPHLDAEIATLIVDISLHSRHQDVVVNALQEIVRIGELNPDLKRNIGKLVRSRTVNIRPLRQVPLGSDCSQ